MPTTSSNQRDVYNVPVTNLISDQQVEIILNNIRYYFDDLCDDPHQELAFALGVSRQEAKRMLYLYMYRSNSYMPDLQKRGTDREIYYLRRLNLSSDDRRYAIEEAHNISDEKSEIRKRRSRVSGLYR